MVTIMYTRTRSLRRWEIALLIGLAIAALVGVWLDRTQSGLAENVIRLHVIANSDSASDQALKLRVRDAILAEADALIPSDASLSESRALLAQNLHQLAQTGAQVVHDAGCDYPVTASLEDDVWFPTKTYTDFAFPAGRYTALRVSIGDAEGQNWWCVVFPPLCMGSVTETAAQSDLTDKEVALITGENEGYVLKFKAVELWEQFKEWLTTPAA